MKYDQLSTLEAIVISGTFRAAAEKLNKSQSAVSHAIRLLEDELGFKLFSRAAYRPVLTPQGDVFYREASRILRQMDELGTTAARLRAHQETELCIAVTNTFPLTTLLGVMADVSHRHPATHIRLATESMGGPVSRLIEGSADIAIATLDGITLNEVEAYPIVEVIIRPVASPTLAAKLGQGVAPMTVMQGHVQVVVAGTGGPALDQSRDLLPGGLKWTVSDFSAKKQVILSGLGWGGLPDHLTEVERASGDLLPIDVESYPARHSVLHALRRRGSPPGLVANDLWNQLMMIGR